MAVPGRRTATAARAGAPHPFGKRCGVPGLCVAQTPSHRRKLARLQRLGRRRDEQRDDGCRSRTRLGGQLANVGGQLRVQGGTVFQICRGEGACAFDDLFGAEGLSARRWGPRFWRGPNGPIPFRRE